LIKRALISVHDKNHLEALAGYLEQNKVEIVSSGGTYDYLHRMGVSAKRITDITGAPEILGGRVKTLHPAVYGGILARIDQLDELKQHSLDLFDLVVVNLYPFEKIVADGAQLAEALENIDIGGPSMLRAAAKNFPRVTAVCSPADYESLIEEMKTNNCETTIEFRRSMALKVFASISAYDNAIASYLIGKDDLFRDNVTMTFQKLNGLRYGENPHQQAALYIDSSYVSNSIAKAKILSGKELSFNNIWDLEAALQMAMDFKPPFAAVIKHTNPCGAAIGATLAEAYEKALASDPLSAFGSGIALNREVDMATARLIHNTEFIECVLAPDYNPNALELMRKKKTRRLLAVGKLQAPVENDLEMRAIAGGALFQTRDHHEIKSQDLNSVTKIKPTPQQIEDLLFGFQAVKHVKSNAVLICKDGATLGMGPGQTSRVDASLIAVRKAGGRALGAVAASDAFFPMPDGLEVLAEAGVTAVIQPGGSKADPDIIAVADRLGVAMVFTGIRHFKH
jgi:phosphoribosylaminoimidazolecarboxamide formyltransferase/IMP cyclohydrolase